MEVIERTKFLPIRQFAEKHGWPTEHALRHWIFEDRRGFNRKCTRRLGRQILIDEAAVFEWLDELPPIDGPYKPGA